MLSFLRGEIVELSDNHIIIDTGSVGYKVFCSKSSLEKFQNLVRNEALVYTELIIREDSWLLYGFANTQEREWFRLLLMVQGVGAKVALSILSCQSPSDLFQAVYYEDKDKLCMADGVGSKLAVRIINELKDKKIPIAKLNISSDGSPPKTGENYSADKTSVIMDVVSALVNLGYKKADVLGVLRDIPSDQGFEDILRQALSKLT